MALPSSGQITLNQVNVELGLSATAQIGLGDSNVRALFNVSSGQIKMSDGYGKSSETVISSSVQEMTVSNYISSGGTLRISSGVYIWSDNVATAGMIIDIPCTIINQGYIIGRGGDANVSGGSAINVTSSGVTITNNSGAYIAGGGGGGGTGRNGQGGGGAGGGGSNGGAIGQVGGNGVSGSAGGGAGGGGAATTNAGGLGGGGGRILPGSGGVGGSGYGINGGNGGGAGNAGANGVDGGGDSLGSFGTAGGGGGWGASGGNGYYTPAGSSQLVRYGGAGGSAISGTARTLNNSGTIYGST